MAHLVKTKFSILSVSVIVSVFITALQSGFYRTPTIKRWDAKEQLSWEDFKGIPVPFSKYGAAINSKVFIEYDSVKREFTAYAGQNNLLSWKKIADEYGLTHEQYHFNITELYARKLNKFFSEAGDITLKEAEEKMTEINNELSHYQDKYDLETNHSLKRTKQNYWEFKVDSALQEYTINRGVVTDQLAGISAQFTKAPEFRSGINSNGLAYRGYGQVGYQMNFALLSLKFTEVTDENFEEYCNYFVLSDSTQVVENSIIKEDGYSIFNANKIDISHTQEIWDRVYKYGGDIFWIRIEAPYDSLNQEYEQIKDSFLNSINFSETRDYWIEKAKNEGVGSDFTYLSTKKTDEGGEQTSFCLMKSDNIFFKPPFVDNEGNLYIAFEIVADPEESVMGNFALINRNEMFKWKVDSAEQLLVLPDNLLPDDSFELDFGYTLMKDSLKPCYQFLVKSDVVDKNE